MTNGQGPNLQELLQTAQRVQEEIQRIQEQLGKQKVEGSAGGGMVVAVANGRQQLVSVRIEREVVDPNEIDMLQDLVVAAVNQAMAKAQALAQEEMAKVTGRMNIAIPGLP